MKKYIFYLAVLGFVFSAESVLGQSSVGTLSTNENLLLWIESQNSDGGLVIPRLSTTERDANLENDDPTDLPKNHPCGGGNPPCETDANGDPNLSVIPIGTTIFNTSSQNLEWWNGQRWTKSLNAGFASGSALPEIFIEDQHGSASPQTTYVWGNAGVNGGVRLIFQMNNIEDANGYTIDRRSPDVKSANLCEWNTGTQTFFPDTKNGTYDFVFEFDPVIDAGANAPTFVIEAWDATDITSYNSTTGTVVVAAGAEPVSASYQVVPKGNNNSYNNYPVLVRVFLTQDLFTNGLRFTIYSDTETMTIDDLACIITRIR